MDALTQVLTVKNVYNGYDPGHPWWYALGNEPILPYELKVFRKHLKTTILEEKEVTTPAQYKKLFAKLLSAEQDLLRDLKGYIHLIKYRGETVDHWRKHMTTPHIHNGIDIGIRIEVGMNLGLKYNHSCWGLTRTQAYALLLSASKYAEKFQKDYHAHVEKSQSFYLELYNAVNYPHECIR